MALESITEGNQKIARRWNMAGSLREGKDWTAIELSKLDPKPTRFLDIGCGRGTYSRLFREQYPGFWEGVEIFKPYIDKYKLTTRYDIVRNCDAREYSELFPTTRSFATRFDVAFCGDVLEHMTAEQAVKVYTDLLKRCKNVFVSMPIVGMKQGPEPVRTPTGIVINHNETHIVPDWKHDKVMSAFPHIAAHFKGKKLGVYLGQR